MIERIREALILCFAFALSAVAGLTLWLVVAGFVACLFAFAYWLAGFGS